MCSTILSIEEFESHLCSFGESKRQLGYFNNEDEYPPEYVEKEQREANNSMAALTAAYRALHETKAATVWEADHQRTALEHYGLAEEFPFGCDAIEHVAEALVCARKRLMALRERQNTACDECGDLFDGPPWLCEDCLATKNQIIKELRAVDAPALEALLTRDKRGYYNLWVIPGNKKPDAAAPAFTYYDESAVPESLRLPLNGGPAKVRLVMLPAKEADDGDN